MKMTKILTTIEAKGITTAKLIGKLCLIEGARKYAGCGILYSLARA